MYDIWIPLIGGLALLIGGGELLVRGSVRLAEGVGVSPLVIGLTLVGFGTSTPELVTSIQAALIDAPGIAYGNIVGSNIANILLVGGITALVSPILMQDGSLRRDSTVMATAACLFTVAAVLGPLDRWAGAAGLALLAAYIVVTLRIARRSPAEKAGSAARPPALRLAGDLALTLAGLGLVLLGGKGLVGGSVALARDLGISETVIGLTIVAVGTSMPELVTSAIAGLRRQGAIAIGNIVGSNIYNILFIGGATALIAPGPVPAAIVRFDNTVMLGATGFLLGAVWFGLRLGRAAGATLLGGYALYIYAIWP